MNISCSFTGRCKAVLMMALVTSFALAGCAVADDAPKWIPGQPYPVEGLKKFACHDYRLPCGQLRSPDIEQVSYSGPRDGDAARGEAIATNTRWGNCIACHSLPKGHQGGEIGPDLSQYGQRNAPFDYTFQRIWDARVFNPNVHMPVYGPNGVLTSSDILDVMAFLDSGK